MQEANSESIKKYSSPLIQFGVSVLLGWVGIGVCRLLHLQEGTEYFAAFFAIVLYCMASIVISLAYESYLRYTVPGWYLYVLLAGILLLSAKFSSGISIWTLYEFRMMLISITIFYFLASNMVRDIRLIYEAADKGF